MFDRLAEIGVVPVVVVDQVEHAIPLADALAEGGIPVVEVTFRTPAAANVIRVLRKERPQMVVGAGTVVTADNLRAAVDAGAQFGVAPGCNPKIVEASRTLGLPFIPGICTPSEIEIAASLGGTLLKYFPAEPAGGLAFLSAIATPFRHLGIQFMPSGGITLQNLEAYLASNFVRCVGGTWLAKAEDLLQGNWDAIRQRCQEASECVKRVRSVK